MKMKPSDYRKLQFSLLWVTITMLTLPMIAAAVEFGKPALGGYSDYVAPANINESGDNGQVAITTLEINFSLPVNLSTNSNLGINWGVGRSFFDFRKTDNLKFSNGSRPWSDLYFSNAGFNFNYIWNKKWSSFIGLGGNAGWEDEIDDAFSLYESFGASYNSAFDLRWTLGVGFRQGPENNGWGPFGSIAWNEDRKSKGQPGFCASVNWPPAAEICYVVDSKWAVRSNFAEFSGIFRLADDNDVSPSGLLITVVEKISLSVDYMPIAPLLLTFGIAYNMERCWDIGNEGGSTLQTVDLDEALGFQFNINWVF